MFFTQFSEKLQIGQVLDCIVTSTSSDKRMAQLQIDKNKAKTNFVSDVILPRSYIARTSSSSFDTGLVAFIYTQNSLCIWINLGKHLGGCSY